MSTSSSIAENRKNLKNQFRQTRYEDHVGHLVIQIKDAVIELKNWSRTGLGFECSDSLGKFEVKSIVPQVKVTCGEIVLHEGPIKIERVMECGEGKTYYGASFSGGIFITEGIDAAMSVAACSNEFKDVASAIEDVNPEFCQSVLALNAALRVIKKGCEQEQLRWRNMTYDQRCEAERIFIHNLSCRVKEAFTYFDVKIAKQIDVETLPEDSIYHRIFHEEIYPYFENSDIIRRAYEKPRGYAGDYEMMNQIYRNGFEGPNLFGRVLHHYIINEHSGESVKFRKPYFYNYYQKLLSRPGVQNVLSVACGPAVEFQEIVQNSSQSDLDRLNVTLFDLDREALEHAQTKIYKLSAQQSKNPKVTFINASVKSFLTTAGDTSEKYDLIYSAGLFDYLDNLTSAALIRKFFNMLNPEGYIIIGNFTKDNMTKAYLHLLANWSLIHKTEEEMRNWAAGIPNCSVEIEYDRLKMNAFLVVKRNND